MYLRSLLFIANLTEFDILYSEKCHIIQESFDFVLFWKYKL